MRILVDQSFPSSVELNRLLDLELWRWTLNSINDVDLVVAASGDFSGVLFLGVQPLLSSSVQHAGRAHNLALLATKETDPMEAARAIGNNLGTIARVAAPGSVHVIYARGVKPWAEAMHLDEAH